MSWYQSRTARERRILVWGGSFSALALFFYLGVKPFSAALSDASEQLAFERDALAREQAAIAAAKQNPQLQHIADSLMQIATPRLFAGNDDVMASAELVSFLDDVAGKHHVLLSEDATRPVTKPKSGVRTLNVDIRGESDLHGILEFLQALERGPKQLRVSRLEISKPTRDADDIETMIFAATVSGYALAAEPPALMKMRKSHALSSDSAAQLKTDASKSTAIPGGAP